MGDLLGSPRVAFPFLLNFPRVHPPRCIHFICNLFLSFFAQPARGSSSAVHREAGRHRAAGRGAHARRGAGGGGGAEGVHKGEEEAEYVGCDHTSTKAPDPIRTPKLSVLGRE